MPTGVCTRAPVEMAPKTQLDAITFSSTQFAPNSRRSTNCWSANDCWLHTRKFSVSSDLYRPHGTTRVCQCIVLLVLGIMSGEIPLFRRGKRSVSSINVGLTSSELVCQLEYEVFESWHKLFRVPSGWISTFSLDLVLVVTQSLDRFSTAWWHCWLVRSCRDTPVELPRPRLVFGLAGDIPRTFHEDCR